MRHLTNQVSNHRVQKQVERLLKGFSIAIEAEKEADDFIVVCALVVALSRLAPSAKARKRLFAATSPSNWI